MLIWREKYVIARESKVDQAVPRYVLTSVDGGYTDAPR